METQYDLMLSNDETWYEYQPGSAFIMSDCSLMDN